MITSSYVVAVPAYGRDYKSEAAVRRAWEAGNDFRCLPQGEYINKQDADHYKVAVRVRYNNQTKTVLLGHPLEA